MTPGWCRPSWGKAVPAVTNEVTLVAALPAPTVTVVVGPPLVDLLFDQPAATDADLVFGANYIARATM